MSLRSAFLILILWSLPFKESYGQLIADFTFDDTSDMPASLKKNAAGPDALDINPHAQSDGFGVYTVPDPDFPDRLQHINLKIAQSLFEEYESIYMEWDFRSQEAFAWLINNGFDKARFGHAFYPDQPDQQGFHLRYATKADPSILISSGFVGEPLQNGERATIGFMYDKESGTAYIFKNGEEVWQTPDDQKTPGYGLHWETADGYFTVGAEMNGDQSTTPSLYRYRVFEEACATASPPLSIADTVCRQGPATLSARGGEEGQYRWYTGDGTTFTPIPGEESSTFTTETLYESKTYYVSIASEDCESPRIPVQAVVLAEPEIPEVSFTPPCGPDETTVFVTNKQEGQTYLWYATPGADPLHQDDSLSLHVEQDTTIYISASNGVCESALVPVNIRPKDLPLIDAGPDHRILKGESVDLAASGTYVSLSWAPHQSLQFPESPNPRATPESTRSYVVTAISAEGCELSDTVTVFVIDKFPVPNAFSPNNDGTNDNWEIPTIENYPDCRVEVYNKWGNKVFSSKGYQEPWDGTFQGKALPSGTYYYTLRLASDKDPIKGSVLLIY